MFETLRFPFIKTIASKRYDKAFGLGDTPILTGYNQDFIFNIKFGNILKSSGDILLCPLSEDFKPSNPLSRKIIKKEGKWLKKTIDELYTSEHPQWIGSEHVAFLPCRKLKYRGIFFVSVDFYSENREEINALRIAEALEVAHKYNCKKLTCPQNLLYNPNEKYSFDYLYYQWNRIIQALNHKAKIDFVIETIVQRNLTGFHMLQNSMTLYDFSNSLVEYLPNCAQILPHYRKQLKSINTAYYFSEKTAKQIRCLLTSEIKQSHAERLFNKLFRLMGAYGETSPSSGNEGFIFYLLGLCHEMPWNFLKLKELFDNLPKDMHGSFDNFIFKERFRDISKFEYRSKL